ncbi:tRNA-adenosine deaminase [Microbacteriaceae bacterium MWH-Ta3]|nr:tRNA-adenosine deaminase [Microbacteriaceae bacterium MWH-Ta3]
MKATDADERAMRAALVVAKRALDSGDVPVGALVLDASGAVIASGFNERELTGDPTAHAEIVALRRAAQETGNWNLSGHTLVVTLEPCVMCAGAILSSRISRVVFGAWDDKAGAVGSALDVLRNPALPIRVEEVVAGVLAEETAGLLTDFFAAKR